MERANRIATDPSFQVLCAAVALVLLNWPVLPLLLALPPAKAFASLIFFWLLLIFALFWIARSCMKCELNEGETGCSSPSPSSPS